MLSKKWLKKRDNSKGKHHVANIKNAGLQPKCVCVCAIAQKHAQEFDVKSREIATGNKNIMPEQIKWWMRQTHPNTIKVAN